MPTEVQPNPQTDAATSGSWGQARLGPHAVIYVLFGIREVPQASTGFTPFELLVGLLDVVREAWKKTAHATPLHDRTCERDERTNRPGHAISPGAPHQGSACGSSSVTTEPPNLESSRPGDWMRGPCPQLSLQIPGQLAGSVYRHGEDQSRH